MSPHYLSLNVFSARRGGSQFLTFTPRRIFQVLLPHVSISAVGPRCQRPPGKSHFFVLQKITTQSHGLCNGTNMQQNRSQFGLLVHSIYFNPSISAPSLVNCLIQFSVIVRGFETKKPMADWHGDGSKIAPHRHATMLRISTNIYGIISLWHPPLMSTNHDTFSPSPYALVAVLQNQVLN